MCIKGDAVFPFLAIESERLVQKEDFLKDEKFQLPIQEFVVSVCVFTDSSVCSEQNLSNTDVF